MCVYGGGAWRMLPLFSLVPGSILWSNGSNTYERKSINVTKDFSALLLGPVIPVLEQCYFVSLPNAMINGMLLSHLSGRDRD